MTAEAARPPQSRLLGIALRVGATSLFGFMAAAIKVGHESGISTVELVFYRQLLGLPPLLAWIAWTGHFSAWRTSRPRAHVTRWAIGILAMGLSFSALDLLPLAEATTIGFAAPLFAVLLSGLVLGEKVGRYRLSAVLLGFLGVVIVMRPGGDALSPLGLAMAVGGALCVATVTLTIRQISRTESVQTTVLWFTGLSVLAAGMLMPFYAETHDARGWIILVVIGLAGGTAQIMMVASLKAAPVAVVAPFDYVQLLWAVLLGWALWSVHPPATTWIGAAVIVGSGLFTLYREHRLGLLERKREAEQVEPL